MSQRVFCALTAGIKTGSGKKEKKTIWERLGGYIEKREPGQRNKGIRQKQGDQRREAAVREAVRNGGQTAGGQRMTADRNMYRQEEDDMGFVQHRPQRGERLKPLDVIDGFQVRPGFYNRTGATATSNGVSFTIQSFGATSCTLLLFHPQESEPYARLKFP